MNGNDSVISEFEIKESPFSPSSKDVTINSFNMYKEFSLQIAERVKMWIQNWFGLHFERVTAALVEKNKKKPDTILANAHSWTTILPVDRCGWPWPRISSFRDLCRNGRNTQNCHFLMGSSPQIFTNKCSRLKFVKIPNF